MNNYYLKPLPKLEDSEPFNPVLNSQYDCVQPCNLSYEMNVANNKGRSL